MISAASSGCGKTTFTMGLLRALRNRGLKVQPYKCGPDYIDTKWHTLAAGRESVNLDTWMGGKEHVRHIFNKYSHEAEVCVAEGAMGMFDGYDKAAGSCAEVACLTASKTVLVINARATAYSVSPMIYGFKHFGQQHGTEIAGVVFNQVASENHFAYLKEACKDAGVECFGYLKKEKDISLPSRHLGLTIDERFRIDAFIEKVAGLVEATVDIDRIVASTAVSPECSDAEDDTSPIRRDMLRFPFFPELRPVRTAIAQDEAFNFTYRANIDYLKAMSKEVVFFSPCKDQHLPPGTDFLYLPGGYPEFFLEELESNKSMRQSVHEYIERGGYAYAECGGMLYLCQHIVGLDNCCHEMTGTLRVSGTFEGMKLHLGYRELKMQSHAPDGIPNIMRGHEFHYSDINTSDNPELYEGIQYSAKGEATRTRLFRHKNLIAGYTHFYWANLWNR